MNQNSENDFLKRAPLSYELIVRNNKAPRENGEPHLILRRQPRDEDQKKLMDESKPAEEKQTVEDGAQEISSVSNIADYISSLHHHVSDEVNRVIDAIIEEEGNVPSNLPKLDDQLTMIYPGSDVEGMPGDDLFFERKTQVAAEIKPSNYTNRVEYEDL